MVQNKKNYRDENDILLNTNEKQNGNDKTVYVTKYNLSIVSKIYSEHNMWTHQGNANVSLMTLKTDYLFIK